MDSVATFNEGLWFAIAEPSRRKLLDILLIKGDSTASKLANEVPFSRQAVSKHMNVLRQAGLIKEQKVGKEVRFIIKPKGLKQASRELSQVARLWDERLLKIKDVAESIQQAKEM